MTQPTDPVLAVAADATFLSSDEAATIGEPVRVAQSAAVAAQGHIPGNALLFQHLNSQLGTQSDELIHRRDDVTAWCGPGSDGDVTVLTGTTLTLTRDMYYDQFTVDVGGTVTGGYRIFAIRGEFNGTWHVNGEAGEDATPGAPDTAGARGQPAPSGSIRGGVQGGDGAEIGGADGDDGGDATIPRIGSAGGDGGDGSANTGGLGGSFGRPTAAQGGIEDIHAFTRGYLVDTTSTGEIVPLVGGLGGGGGASNVAEAGGGGGGGAGIAIGVFNELVVGATGVIQANGGAGGSGTGLGVTPLDGGPGGAGAIRLAFRRATIDTVGGATIETLDGDGTDQSSSNVRMLRV